MRNRANEMLCRGTSGTTDHRWEEDICDTTMATKELTRLPEAREPYPVPRFGALHRLPYILPMIVESPQAGRGRLPPISAHTAQVLAPQVQGHPQSQSAFALARAAPRECRKVPA